jgi:hypothetical protein
MNVKVMKRVHLLVLLILNSMNLIMNWRPNKVTRHQNLGALVNHNLNNHKKKSEEIDQTETIRKNKS